MLKRKNITLLISLLTIHQTQTAVRTPQTRAHEHTVATDELTVDMQDLDQGFADFNEALWQESEQQPESAGLSIKLQRAIERIGVQLLLGWFYIAEKFDELIHGK